MTAWSTVFTDADISAFMKPEVSQDPDLGPYPKRDEYSPQLPTIYHSDPF